VCRIPNTLVLPAQFSQLGVYVAPRSPTEVKLADIWRKTFAMDKVGISDSAAIRCARRAF
jgi:hypothetical protein